MPLGNNYQNTNQMSDPNYYSRLRIKNPKENMSLGFTFWKSTLKVSIIENDSTTGKSNDLAYIYLSPTKAQILANAVTRIINDPESDDVFGVDTGAGEIRGFIAIGRNNGIPFLFIAKVNSEGKYESSQRFNFNMNYNYLLKVHSIDSLKCQKEYMNDVELNQFANLLIDYSRSASGALGASFYDIGRYETAKLTGMIRRISDKVGAEKDSKSNSFFNNLNQKPEVPARSQNIYGSIDDLDERLG